MNGRRTAPFAQAGFSITELLVAVAVSMILLGGVIQLLVSNKQAYRIQEGTSVLNENARFALQRIQEDVRMGGNWAGAAADAARVHTDIPALSDACTKRLASALDLSIELVGIEGIEGDATGSPLSDCIFDQNYVLNSDIIVVRFATTEAVSTTNPGSGGEWVGDTNNQNDLFLRSAVGYNAVVAKGSNIGTAAGGNPALSDTSDPAGIGTYRYRTHAYYVRPCQTLSGTKCNATVDATPTLVRLTLDGTTPVHEDLVAGVEQMQALYGVDLDDDGNAERYLPAASVTNWNLVVSARVNLVIRGLERDVSYTSPASVRMLDNFTHTVPSTARDFRRKQYTTVVQLRNLSRG